MIATRHLGLTAAVALSVAALLLRAAPAAAQGACNTEKLAGTYAYEFHGSGTFVLGPVDGSARHWSLQMAPISSVGWMTFQADGTMNGGGWTIIGRTTGGLNPTSMAGALVGLDPQTCTAELAWHPVYPGGVNGPLHRDRLLFVKNGQEYRSVLVEPPTKGMVWFGRGQRITQEPGEVRACGPHLLKGDVLIQAETLRRPPSPLDQPRTVDGAASVHRLTVADDGSYTGTLHTIDQTSRSLEVHGAFDVQPDCTFGVTLASTELPGVTQHGRGVLFGEGKGGFLILPLETTQADGSIVKPVFARGELIWLGR